MKIPYFQLHNRFLNEYKVGSYANYACARDLNKHQDLSKTADNTLRIGMSSSS